jgi:2-C-methyl-D-erythritol 4-phosphate cytidylyltransferase/2-C-methyl-D-erythritol 2,4-cyclodiphosphate synthase
MRLSDGRTVLRAAADALLAGGVARLVIVGAPGPEHQLEALGERVAAVVAGGVSRADSVAAGLLAVPETVAWVAVHDGARPFASPRLIADCIAAAQRGGAAVPVLACTDTIAVAGDEGLKAALERHELRRIQTPQVMRRGWLAEVVACGGSSDESSVLLRLGHPVATCPGSEENRKVTHRDDLRQNRRFITGFGFDVHRFDPARQLMLGGVHLEGEPGLAGHSDADVLLHALVDALLGAVGGGDIGVHFPDTDARFKDADSAEFVLATLEKVEAAGGVIEHIDLTVIGERPKIAPYRQQICVSIATLLSVDPRRVNLKATTTEGLGFCGRGEGLAAQAIASLSLPPLEPRS